MILGFDMILVLEAVFCSFFILKKKSIDANLMFFLSDVYFERIFIERLFKVSEWSGKNQLVVPGNDIKYFAGIFI